MLPSAIGENANVHSSSNVGKNVTLAVICFMISLISPWTSFSVFSFGFPPGFRPLIVLPCGTMLDETATESSSSRMMSNCQRSSVSSVSFEVMARTRRLMVFDINQAGGKRQHKLQDRQSVTTHHALASESCPDMPLSSHHS